MPQHTQNLQRNQAIREIRAKFLRAVGVGSPTLLSKLIAGFTAEEEGAPLSSSEVTVPIPKEDFAVTLTVSVHEETEKCGVQFCGFPIGGFARATPFKMDITCMLTARYGERWNVDVQGKFADVYKDCLAKMGKANYKFTESEALSSVTDIAKSCDGNI